MILAGCGEIVRQRDPAVLAVVLRRLLQSTARPFGLGFPGQAAEIMSEIMAIGTLKDGARS